MYFKLSLRLSVLSFAITFTNAKSIAQAADWQLVPQAKIQDYARATADALNAQTYDCMDTITKRTEGYKDHMVAKIREANTIYLANDGAQPLLSFTKLSGRAANLNDVETKTELVITTTTNYLAVKSYHYIQSSRTVVSVMVGDLRNPSYENRIVEKTDHSIRCEAK